MYVEVFSVANEHDFFAAPDELRFVDRQILQEEGLDDLRRGAAVLLLLLLAAFNLDQVGFAVQA